MFNFLCYSVVQFFLKIVFFSFFSRSFVQTCIWAPVNCVTFVFPHFLARLWIKERPANLSLCGKLSLKRCVSVVCVSALMLWVGWQEGRQACKMYLPQQFPIIYLWGHTQPAVTPEQEPRVQVKYLLETELRQLFQCCFSRFREWWCKSGGSSFVQ